MENKSDQKQKEFTSAAKAKIFFEHSLFYIWIITISLKINFTWINNQAGIYLIKIINKSTKKRCEICSKLTITFGVFIVNFEHISHLVLVSLLLTLNM